MFDTRERSAEARFVHERDVAFQAHALRDRMFGRWAAGLMGMKGQAQEDYARSLMLSDIAGATDDLVLQKVRGDLAERGIDEPKASDDRLRRKLARLHAIAQAELGSAS